MMKKIIIIFALPLIFAVSAMAGYYLTAPSLETQPEQVEAVVPKMVRVVDVGPDPLMQGWENTFSPVDCGNQVYFDEHGNEVILENACLPAE